MDASTFFCGDQASELAGFRCPCKIKLGPLGLGVGVGTLFACWFGAKRNFDTAAHVPRPPATSRAALPPMMTCRRERDLLPACATGVFCCPFGESMVGCVIVEKVLGCPVAGEYDAISDSNGVPANACCSEATKVRAEVGR